MTLSGSGVLPDTHLREAIDTGVVVVPEFADRRLQPASLDLTLGPVAHRLRCSFLPEGRVEEKLRDLSTGTIDLSEGGILERNVPYLVELNERLELPRTIRAKANPKSSTGRLDVFTRLLTDNSSRFDEVPRGYAGRLWLEIVPMSFPVKVRQGFAFNQIRLSYAATAPTLTDHEIRERHEDEPLVRVDGEPPAAEDLPVAGGLFLSLDLVHPDHEGVIGYKSKAYTGLLDLTGDALLDPADFWQPLHKEPGHRIVLEPGAFYLLMSREHVIVPPHLAAEMVAYDPTSGELRTHYAGFFDPGFGYAPEDAPRGSRAALEVRAHDVPFLIEHGQPVCKLSYERMAERPGVLYGAGRSSNYQGQETTLSRYFRRAVSMSSSKSSSGPAAPLHSETS